ncbi:rCG45340, partial [Rattus norvegicus]
MAQQMRALTTFAEDLDLVPWDLMFPAGLCRHPYECCAKNSTHIPLTIKSKLKK